MAESAAHRSYRYASRQELCGVEVAQVVQADALHGLRLADPTERPGDRVGVQRVGSVGGRGEHVAVVVERQLAHLGAVLEACSLPFEDVDRVVVEGYPSSRVRLGVLYDRAAGDGRDRALDRQRA